MNAPVVALDALFVLAAYLIGAIPFGYLTAKWLKGVDIRTVGSGNIGATNVGRTFGFRFFLLVFAFDMAKGLLPAWFFPRVAATLSGGAPSSTLGVLVALAAILGHNFPVYLGFKGGKGVATSLGALLALDPIAAVGSAIGFLIFVIITRYVSLSSILGGLVFFLVHFVSVDKPWSSGELAMSVATIGLLGLLVARHRKNIARIAADTEPKVSLRRKREDRSGRASVFLILALAACSALVIGGVIGARSFSRRDVIRVGPYSLSEVHRVGTGHQRAERVAFAAGGKRLAVTCPRYNRLVIYRVSAENRLELESDVELGGKPMAVCAGVDRFYVLERPAGDERHVLPGWWEGVSFDGEPYGERVNVGYYPDDMALTSDWKHLVVLTSGKAEGSPDRGAPALEIYSPQGGKCLGRVVFDQPADDPARLWLSAGGNAAVVTLLGSQQAAAVDLTDIGKPRVIGRSKLPEGEAPYTSSDGEDAIVMPVASNRDAVVVHLPDVGDCLLGASADGTTLELRTGRRRRTLGTIHLKGGTIGLSSTKPLGVAFSPERKLIAVATRSGGVHLLAVQPAPEGTNIAARGDVITR